MQIDESCLSQNPLTSVSPKRPAARETAQRQNMGTVISRDGSALPGTSSSRNSSPGKNAFTTTVKRYPAVSRAEMRRITGGSTAHTPIPSFRAAEAMTHLLKNPPMGGMPTRERDAAVKKISFEGAHYRTDIGRTK